MLFVQAEVELLKIADARAEMGDFIDGGGFATGGATSKHGHQDQEESGEDRVQALHEGRLGMCSFAEPRVPAFYIQVRAKS